MAALLFYAKEVCLGLAVIIGFLARGGRVQHTAVVRHVTTSTAVEAAGCRCGSAATLVGRS